MVASPSAPERPLERAHVPRPLLGERLLFPALEYQAYLGHAAIAPVHTAGLLAAHACLDDVSHKGAGAFLVWDAQRRRLRESLARLLGASASEVALTPGTTRGVSDLALALPWRSGDVLVTFSGEFPANVTPWQLAAAAFGASVRLLPAPDPSGVDPTGKILEQLAVELAAGARYVAVSAVQFQTGLRMPLQEIGELCREHGALLLVDAIQAAGVVPLDVVELGIAALSSGAHKWLLGIEGAGFLYVRQDLCEQLRPLTAGWVSHEEAETFLFHGKGLLRYDRPLKKSAAVFEGGSHNAVGFAVMEAGLDLCLDLSPASIFSHVQQYHDAMEGIWQARGFRSLRAPVTELRSCLLSFEPPSNLVVATLAMALRQRGIMVSTPDGLIRVAPHFANHLDEVPLVAAALDEVLGELGF